MNKEKEDFNSGDLLNKIIYTVGALIIVTSIQMVKLLNLIENVKI